MEDDTLGIVLALYSLLFLPSSASLHQSPSQYSLILLLNLCTFM